MSALRIWGRATSANVQRVLWMAQEIGLDYERIDAGGAFGIVNDPAYRALNPNGLVPTIDDNGFVLWESNTICRYLADQHGALTLYPRQAHSRARVEQWMDWGNTGLAPAITPVFWQLIRTPADKRDRAAIEASAARTESAMRVLDERLQDRPFLCGDALTLADITCGINTYRWLNMDLASVGHERAPVAAVRAWYERLTQRAAYRTAVMIPIT